MSARFTALELWPTRIGLFEADHEWWIHRALYEQALAASPEGDAPRDAAKRRVRGILDASEAGRLLKTHLFDCARAFLGDGAAYLSSTYCEHRALVIGHGGFISTHKDSREGDITCTYFLTGGGAGKAINSVGNPRFVLEDATRYFDEARLPFEARHGYSVNPRPGLAVFYPSYTPHNQHPYVGDKPHVQIVANFRVELPTHLEERLFD